MANMNDEASLIRRRNLMRSLGWCAVTLAFGAYFALTVSWDAYLEKYYDVKGYSLVLIVQTVAQLALTWGWWHLATSRNVHVTGYRHWISTHGGTATLFSVLTAWLLAVLAHILCTAFLVVGSSGVVIHTVFMLPLLYTAMSYFLPPLEICQVILPGGGLGQKAARILIGLAALGVAGWLFFWDFM